MKIKIILTILFTVITSFSYSQNISNIIDSIKSNSICYNKISKTGLYFRDGEEWRHPINCREYDIYVWGLSENEDTVYVTYITKNGFIESLKYTRNNSFGADYNGVLKKLKDNQINKVNIEKFDFYKKNINIEKRNKEILDSLQNKEKLDSQRRYNQWKSSNNKVPNKLTRSIQYARKINELQQRIYDCNDPKEICKLQEQQLILLELQSELLDK